MFAMKYAPKVFAELVFENDMTRKKVEQFALGQRTNNILLYGPYGSGKSAVAQVIASQSRDETAGWFENLPHDTFNGAEFEAASLARVENGWNLSGQPFAYAVIDEFDLVHWTVQARTRAVMDKYLGRHGLILTTNFLHHVDAAIQSRCDLIEMPALSAASLVPMCQRILQCEEVALNDADVEQLITSRNGDLRGVLRYLERLVERVNGEQQTQAA